MVNELRDLKNLRICRALVIIEKKNDSDTRNHLRNSRNSRLRCKMVNLELLKEQIFTLQGPLKHESAGTNICRIWGPSRASKLVRKTQALTK